MSELNVFVIPSWFPSDADPIPGAFVWEQSKIYARNFPDDRVTIGHWGPNDPDLLFDFSSWYDWPGKLMRSRMHKATEEHFGNLHMYFSPSRTWSRKIRSGNIKNITTAIETIFHSEVSNGRKPDIIHAHVGYPAGYIAMELSRKFDIPYLITEHMGPFPFPAFKKSNGIDPVLLKPLQQADRVLAVSKYLQDDLKSHQVAAEVFHNFIDDQRFQLSTKVKKEEGPTFLHVGRLEPEKNQELIVRSFANVSTDSKLIIAGSGSQEKRLRTMAASLQVSDRIAFLGEMDKNHVQSLYQMADAFLLSSIVDNFPGAVLEALACGLPVISTRCGGPEEMINDTNGILVDTSDLSGFSEKIATFDTAKYDSLQIREDFLKRFGSVEATRKLRKIYEEIIS